jgi:hypothetical protein
VGRRDGGRGRNRGEAYEEAGGGSAGGPADGHGDQGGDGEGEDAIAEDADGLEERDGAAEQHRVDRHDRRAAPHDEEHRREDRGRVVARGRRGKGIAVAVVQRGVRHPRRQDDRQDQACRAPRRTRITRRVTRAPAPPLTAPGAGCSAGGGARSLVQQNGHAAWRGRVGGGPRGGAHRGKEGPTGPSCAAPSSNRSPGARPSTSCPRFAARRCVSVAGAMAGPPP